ncbi:MAG: indolepyruvate oxidoreductase subunit beta [Coprothermobacterota bacterium]|nr:indolepyruvate oxidoreductase subunit beta [Coprothermobacterota bacterium]
MNAINFLVCGVGGQGTVVASDILSNVGLASGYEVKKSDVLGLAQRGGSVISHIRWSNQAVHAPMVGLGEIDYMLAFERLEAVRRLPYMKPEGTVIVNAQEIHPIAVTTGQMAYPSPSQILATLQANVAHVYEVNALATALTFGSSRTVNTVLLGAISHFFPASASIWEEAISQVIRPKLLELNIKAFHAGRALMEGDSQ